MKNIKKAWKLPIKPTPPNLKHETKMEKDYILSRLCEYDSRNPDHVEDGAKKDECYCENCFYGRTILAEEILRLKEAIEKAIQSLTHLHHLPEHYLSDGVTKTVKTLKTL